MTIKERQRIFNLKNEGKSIREIMILMGYKSPRTIAYWLHRDDYLSTRVCSKAIAFEKIHRLVRQETGFDTNISDALTNKILTWLGFIDLTNTTNGKQNEK